MTAPRVFVRFFAGTFSAAVLCLLAWTGPAKADTKPDALFLGSLQKAAELPSAPDDPMSSIGAPAPMFKSCSISRDCGDGNTVACTGTASCAYSAKGVKCDSNEVACPNYCLMSWLCECGGRSYCWSLRGDCGVTNTGCDGRPQLCPFCQ